MTLSVRSVTVPSGPGQFRHRPGRGGLGPSRLCGPGPACGPRGWGPHAEGLMRRLSPWVCGRATRSVSLDV